MRDMTAEAVVALLGLQPHPEGGHYRETFRDSAMIKGRAKSTAIYFLLEAGVVSRWHKVDAVETWHWYGGAALDLRMAADASGYEPVRLGGDLANGERPQAIVPNGYWQQATSLGAWTLVGCTVAPGFTFEGFVMAPVGFAPLARPA
jgi:uncharacterized protein